MPEVKQSPPQSQSLRRLALLAAGHTGADIERLVREARRGTRRTARPLCWSDIAGALHEERLQIPDHLRWRTAVHEAGHAVAYTLLEVGEVVTARIGTATGGKVETRIHQAVLQDEEGLMRLMACMLAGRAAESAILDAVTVGSGGHPSSDLANATELAVELETALGCSPDRPLLYRPPEKSRDALLYHLPLADRVNSRLVTAMETATELLVAHEAALLAVAHSLQDHCVLEGEQVRKLIATTGIAVGGEP